MKRKLILCLPLVLLSCGGGQGSPPAPAQKVTAADEVLRLGDTWVSAIPTKGILSPPSEVSMYRTLTKSTLHLSETAVDELLVIEETLVLRSGPEITCRTEFRHPLEHRWGRREGEPALELLRPRLDRARDCDGPHPDGAFSEAAKRAIFVLRSDSLVAVEPVVDKRSYIPGSE